MVHRSVRLAFWLPLILAATGHAQTGKGGGPNKRPADTPVIVVLPHAGDLGCGTTASSPCRLTGDEDNVYVTAPEEGVNAVLLNDDGNLSLQFPGTGTRKSITFPREIVADLSHPNGPLTSPLPDLNTLQPDLLFAAPDRGDGLNCLLPDRPCCVDADTCFGTFGTVTGTWDQVRLSYRFTAETTAGEERYWNLRWHDIDGPDPRFAKMECVEWSASRCNVWRVTANVATLTSHGRGNDVQPVGDFELAAQIVVCRAGVTLTQGPCQNYLTTSP